MDYLCSLCGRVGVPEDGFTLMDDRYVPGRCPFHIRGKVTLLRRDVYELLHFQTEPGQPPKADQAELFIDG